MHRSLTAGALFRNLSILVVGLIFLGGPSCAVYAVNFTEIARFNLDSTANLANPEYIGGNPSAVAWNGSRLFVGGYQNSAFAFEDVSLIEVLSATSTGVIASPTFGTRFQTRFTPQFRGYISLDLSADGSSLVGAYDDGVTGTTNGLFMVNTSDYSLRWGFNARGTSGAAFDPGFSSVDSGAAFGAFGSGRRRLFNSTTGAEIYNLTNGMIWYDGSTPGVNTRDMDFDPDTGDIYVRHSNRLTKAVRTGGNTTGARTVLFLGTQADFVAHQNLSFMSNTTDGDLIIFNDRSSNSGGQEFANVIKVINPTGASVSATFTFLEGYEPPPGAGWFDFDFDHSGKKLALLDSSARKVHIFNVGAVAPNGDFNGDSLWNCLDIDSLVAAIAGGTNPPAFDLTGDNLVNSADLDRWLVVGGANNPAQTGGNPFLKGDADLSGSVDGRDFNIWNENKSTNQAAWCKGDFTANGVIDNNDFREWFDRRFQSSMVVVPEPVGGVSLLLLFLGCAVARRAL